MGKAQIQTVPTDSDVAEFLARITDDQERRDSETLIEMMQKISGKPPVMWGPAIIGFGSHHYKYASGREGDMPEIGFSPRKGKLSLYILDDAAKYPEIRKRLGKYTSSKACLYIKKLSDVDIKVLEELITAAYRDVDRRVW